MIIVSQDRDEIINFERITEIVASGKTISITDNIYRGKGEIIGEYETEERAKEVLQDIKQTYEKTLLNTKTGEVTGNYPKVYEMPEN